MIWRSVVEEVEEVEEDAVVEEGVVVEEVVEDAVVRGVQVVVAVVTAVEVLPGEHALIHSYYTYMGSTNSIPATPEEAHAEAPVDSPRTAEAPTTPGEPQRPTPRVVAHQAA